MRRNLVELGSEETSRRKGSGQTNNQTNENRMHPLPDNEPQDIAGLRAERHANADFAGALFDRVCDGTVNSDDRE